MAFITKENSIVYEENGRVLAEVCFPEGEGGTAAITRTFVDEALRGQGIVCLLHRLLRLLDTCFLPLRDSAFGY